MHLLPLWALSWIDLDIAPDSSQGRVNEERKPLNLQFTAG